MKLCAIIYVIFECARKIHIAMGKMSMYANWLVSFALSEHKVKKWCETQFLSCEIMSWESLKMSEDNK